MSDAQVTSWLDRAAALADEGGLTGVRATVDELRNGLHAPGLRVVAVGNGHTAAGVAVNRLLGRDLMPETAASAGVPAVVEVTHSTVDCVEPAGAGTPLTPGWWKELDPAPEHTVRLGVAEPRLAGVHLVAAPVAGPDGAHGRTIRSADAVLLVTAATTPMTMSDLRLLREVLADVDAASVLVAVSHLDRVPEADHGEVMAYVTGRVREASGTVAVVTLAPHAGEPDPALWQWVSEQAGADRAARGAARTALRLRASLTGLADAARDGERAARDAAAERAAAALAAATEIASESAEFDHWRLELRDRQSALSRRFRDHLDATRGALLERLQGELRAADDPRGWWRKELPEQLRTEMARLAGDFGVTLHRSVEADLNWLDGNVFRHTGEHLTLVGDDGSPLTVVSPTTSTSGLADLRQRRMLLRFGPAGVALVGAIIAPGVGLPFAVGAGIAGALVGEALWRNMVDAQRRRVAAQLSELVDNAVEEFASEAGGRMADLYDRMADEALRLRDVFRARRRAQAQPPVEVSEPHWAGLAKRAEELEREISAGVGPIAGTPEPKGAGR
ncbi:hypothetical protein [Catellatospora sp. NPDC049133]|uniref:hypothetical protein n=1 Tax=Catellatospora sp. NPDC049133 TaxID=3155499 RepID=UPI0033F2EF79